MNSEFINKTRETRSRIKEHYYEKEYLKAHDLCIQLLEETKQYTKDDVSFNFYFCYLIASNCSRRLGNNTLAIKYAENGLEYARKESERITIYDALATCYRENNEIELAKSTYDSCIDVYNLWLDKFDANLIKERNSILLSKANIIHNKADMLKDVNLILESIELYRDLLYKKGVDSKDILQRIDKAYRNIEEINGSSIHSSATTPLQAIK